MMNNTKITELTVDELLMLIREAVKEAIHEEKQSQFPETDALGWPLGFFERTYGAFADDPIERPT